MANQHTKKRHPRIKRLIEKWRKRLLLNEWYIDVIYPDEGRCLDGREVIASNSANPAYLNMQISIYPAFFEAPEQLQEETLVHELCHALTQPVWDMMESLHNGENVTPKHQRSAIETLTQRLTNIAFWR